MKHFKFEFYLENIQLFCIAVWLLPIKSKYGAWPRSGEIDLLEARCNEKYGDNVQIGVEQMGSALHFGPQRGQDAYRTSVFYKNNATVNFHQAFHEYEVIWNANGVQFNVDGAKIGYVPAGDGFFARGKFTGDNIWKIGTKMAPFDEEVSF